MNNREDYLDDLLKAVNGSANEKEKAEKAREDRKAPPAEKPSRPAEKKAELSPDEEFLLNFEQELLDLDEDAFIREYEENLGVTHLEPAQREEPARDSGVDGLEDLMVDTMSDGVLSEDFLDMEVNNLDPEFEELFGQGSSPGGAAPDVGEGPTAPEPAEEDLTVPEFLEEGPVSNVYKADSVVGDVQAFQATDFSELDLEGIDFEMVGGDEAQEQQEEAPRNDGEELFDILAEMAGDGELAEIGDMLKAHDEEKFLFEDEMADLSAEGDMGEGMDELGFLDDLQTGGEEEGSGKKIKEKKKKEKKEKKEKSAKEPGDSSGGFWARLSLALFGADEDEEEEVAKPKRGGKKKQGGADDGMDENERLLMEMDEEQAGKKGKKKKEKKEKPPKEPKPKKEKKQKPPKPPKPPKEKKPKEKAAPIPKKPLILLVIFGLSIVALVILGGNLLGYSSGIQAAETSFQNGDYVGAYGEIEGLEIREADQKLYDRIRFSAYLQKQLNFYQVYWDAQMYPEALDALFQALNRYDTYLPEAAAAGADGEFAGMYLVIEQRLAENFSVTVDEAREAYGAQSRGDYTAKVKELLQRMAQPGE